MHRNSFTRGRAEGNAFLRCSYVGFLPVFRPETGTNIFRVINFFPVGPDGISIFSVILLLSRVISDENGIFSLILFFPSKLRRKRYLLSLYLLCTRIRSGEEQHFSLLPIFFPCQFRRKSSSFLLYVFSSCDCGTPTTFLLNLFLTQLYWTANRLLYN